MGGKNISFQTMRRILLKQRPEQGVLPAIHETEPEKAMIVLAAAVDKSAAKLLSFD